MIAIPPTDLLGLSELVARAGGCPLCLKALGPSHGVAISPADQTSTADRKAWLARHICADCRAKLSAYPFRDTP